MGISLRDLNGRIKKGNNLKHGLSKHPIYDCWIAMKARCLNKNNPQYFNYGKRGITVCDRWVNNFENFLEDMGIPEKGMTLDRIDNNSGYSPNNCRWVTIQEQQKNKRTNNIVPGVVFEKDRNKWRADISRFGKRYFLGRFKTFEEAVVAREQAENKYVH